MTIRKSKKREENGPKSRDYLLASLFLGAVILTDPKDGKALIIKTDPAYLAPSKWNTRETTPTQWRPRPLSSNPH